MITHGDLDSVVSVEGAYAFDALAEVAGIPHDLYILPGYGHNTFDLLVTEILPGVTILERLVDFSFAHLTAQAVPALPAAALAATAAHSPTAPRYEESRAPQPAPPAAHGADGPGRPSGEVGSG
jgi:hypothetical protein